MDRLFITLIILVSINSEANAGIRPLKRFFKILPESQSHTYSGTTRDLDLSSESIKVLVWNIKKTQEKPWQNEFLKYGQGKDLFLLQEAYQNELFTSTIEKFENVRWDLGISFLYTLYNNAATGNMIGSKVEPTYVRVRHTSDLEPVVATPKVTTYAKYAVKGSNKELLVVSVHGINLTSYSSFTRHMEQARAEIEAHDGPVLFAGDFNTRTGGRTRYLMNLAKELNLKTVDFRNGHCRMKFKLTPYYLDHTFVRGLNVKNSEVDCASQGSDHKPMSLELALI